MFAGGYARTIYHNVAYTLQRLIAVFLKTVPNCLSVTRKKETEKGGSRWRPL
jgi:hypothetical protein